MPCSALRLIALWPCWRARSRSAVISWPPRPPPRRLGTTAIVSSGVSSSTKPKPGALAGKSRYQAAPIGPASQATRPAPIVDVPRDRKVGIRVQPPVVGVLQHVTEETDVLWPGLADHDVEFKPRSLERVILRKACKKVLPAASSR